MSSFEENHADMIINEESVNKTILEVQRIYMIYKARSEHASIVALKGASFSVEQGQILALVGPSGSGKSSLFNIIGGILKPTAGSVIFEGTDIIKFSEEDLTNFRKSKIGFIFQDGNLLPKITAFENINEAMAFNGYPYEYRKKRTNDLLKLVGVHNRKNQLALKLSGGEKQRVAIARALANSPKLILADEPSGNLDNENSKAIHKLLIEFAKKENKALIVATHDQSLASLCDRVYKLEDGVLKNFL